MWITLIAKYWKVVAFIVVIIAIGFMVNAYNTAIEQASILEQKNSILKASLKARMDAESELKKKMRLLAAEKEIVRQKYANSTIKIKELKDEVSRAWLDCPIPSPVLDVLREGNPGAGTVLPASPSD